jgi:hypothetical protein
MHDVITHRLEAVPCPPTGSYFDNRDCSVLRDARDPPKVREFADSGALASELTRTLFATPVNRLNGGHKEQMSCVRKGIQVPGDYVE